MPEIMLVNPRKRRGRRSAARSVIRRRRRSVKRRARQVLRGPVKAYISNPRRRRRYRRNPSLRGFNFADFAQNTLMPSAVGAAGALGVDMVLGFLPLPPTMKVGPMRPVVRLVGAIGVGMLAGMLATRRTAEQVTAGAVTVVLYDTMKGFIRQTMPAIRLGEDESEVLSYIAPAVQHPNETVGEVEYDGVNEYVDQSVSMYVPEI